MNGILESIAYGISRGVMRAYFDVLREQEVIRDGNYKESDKVLTDDLRNRLNGQLHREKGNSEA
jgi:hypothetical protein